MEVEDNNAPPSDKMPAGFTTLSVEVRKMVYRFAVPSGYVFDVCEQPTFRAYPIARASPAMLMNRLSMHLVFGKPGASEPSADTFLELVDNWADAADEGDSSNSDSNEDGDNTDLEPFSDKPGDNNDADGNDDFTADSDGGEEGGSNGSVRNKARALPGTHTGRSQRQVRQRLRARIPPSSRAETALPSNRPVPPRHLPPDQGGDPRHPVQ